MARRDLDVRSAIVLYLLIKIDEDEGYPSATLMDLVEPMLTPSERVAYARMLMRKFVDDTYPSIPLIERVIRLA